MRREDVDAAFAKVTPRDDAEREKLERLRQRMIEADETRDQLIAGAKQQMADRAESFRLLREISTETRELSAAWRNGLIAAFDEQSELISRIAGLI